MPTYPIYPDIIRARTIREAIPQWGVCLADIVITTQVDFEPIPGLSAILEPSTAYALDGYLAYSADSATDIKVQLVAPKLAIGTWGAGGLWSTAPTGGVGSFGGGAIPIAQVGSQDWFNVGGTGAAGSPGALHACPHAYVQTGSLGGAVQLTFAQLVSSTAPATVYAGSWLRCQKVDDVV